MTIYSVSDIHGSQRALENALAQIIKLGFDEKNPDDKIYFLGDYVDRGFDSQEVLTTIKTLQDELGPKKIVALMGNHDEMFLAWLANGNSLHIANDRPLRTINSFGSTFTPRMLFKLHEENNQIYLWNMDYREDFPYDEIFKAKLRVQYGELLDWYSKLPYFKESKNAIYVHAGFDESGDVHWSESSFSDMTWKYPAEHGFAPWGKPIVAGHIMTRELNRTINGLYDDSIFRSDDHIYLDGAAPITNKLNILIESDDGKFYDGWTGTSI